MRAKSWSGIDPLILRRVDERQERLNRLRPWPAKAAERLWQGLLPAWIAGSNALDGNRLTVEETEKLLNEGGSVPERSLREHLEALNHQEAIAQIRRLATAPKPPRAATVRRLHAVLLAGIDEQHAGRYRKYSMESDGLAVTDLMRQWELWLAGSAQALHPIERAAVAHHRLLRIQPFLDGNGRVARLIMNLSLLRDGYMPAILRAEDRHDYRAALYQADQGNYAPLVELIASSIERVQTMYLLALEP